MTGIFRLHLQMSNTAYFRLVLTITLEARCLLLHIYLQDSTCGLTVFVSLLPRAVLSVMEIYDLKNIAPFSSSFLESASDSQSSIYVTISECLYIRMTYMYHDSNTCHVSTTTKKLEQSIKLKY